MPDVEVVGFDTLSEVVAYIAGGAHEPLPAPKSTAVAKHELDLSDVRAKNPLNEHSK